MQAIKIQERRHLILIIFFVQTIKMTIFFGKKTQIFDTTSPTKFGIRSNSTSSNDDASGKCNITFKKFFPIDCC